MTKTIVLSGGDFGNNHFRVQALPERVEIWYKRGVVDCYKKSVRNQGICDPVVFDHYTRKPVVGSDWFDDAEKGGIKFVGTS